MVSTDANEDDTVRLMLGGDVMLGRGVKQRILRDGPAYPLAPVAALMRGADLTLINLECALTSSTTRWSGAPKAFYFGAPPQAIETLKTAGVDLISLANNHILDFGVDGLRDTIRSLRSERIGFAGAGDNIDAAFSPSIMDRSDIRFGMVALCDHQIDFAARNDRPGMATIDFDDEFAAIGTLHHALESLRRAGVDWPILSLHWGPNLALRPTIKFRRIAHASINMGWKILFGHSAHVFQGIEIYRGYPIIYAAGDLVDDYQVDPDFRNDQQFLFELELTRSEVRRISLYPIVIQDCQARPATAEEADSMANWMALLCGEMGTIVRRHGRKIGIEVSGA